MTPIMTVLRSMGLRTVIYIDDILYTGQVGDSGKGTHGSTDLSGRVW